MILGSKNAARWWSSFVYSFSVALFRDVPGIHYDIDPGSGKEPSREAQGTLPGDLPQGTLLQKKNQGTDSLISKNPFRQA